MAPDDYATKGIVAQDDVTLECGFSIYNYTDSLVWNFRPDKNSSKKLNLETYGMLSDHVKAKR